MSGFVSGRAQIDGGVLLSTDVRLFGPVEIGRGTLVENGVTIGHPAQAAVDTALDTTHVSSVEELYEQCAALETEIGIGCIVRSAAVIYEGCVLGDGAEIAHGSVIRERAALGPYSVLFPNTSVRRGVRIGRGARVAGIVGDRSVLHDYATCLGALVHDYKSGVGGAVEAAPSVETGAAVGRGAVVVGDVTIGEYSLVAAGSVVQRDVPPRVVVAGNPARVVGERRDDEIGRVQERIREGRYL